MASNACSLGTVMQGCSLSPLLYVLYDETMIREAMENADIAYQSEAEWSIPSDMQMTKQW